MQGFNMGRYVPPDQEGLKSGNQIHGKHALGARAKKISQGILTVRFEMPYPIWCTTCPKPTIIGQGVRFNAEKKKIGNYFTTPIYSFRLKHVACGGWIEIHTDPKNTAYVVTQGARKRDLGEDKLREGDVKILTDEEREALRNNAFAALEDKVEDKIKLAYSKKRIEELHDLSGKQWEDPYEKNRNLRKLFREGRKEREKEAVIENSIKDKMSFGLDLLPENEVDAKTASLVNFGEIETDATMRKTIIKPLFRTKPNFKSIKSRSSFKEKAELNIKKTAAIAAEIQSNTRAAMDPFLPGHRSSSTSAGPVLLAGVKRKRPWTPEKKEMNTGPVLVDYDSD
ncbi:hypothetical protein K3495_g2062 [Podosphaera aphanis]|nr:hypothetical protein K3495_g2062 [Podosphaera aphanis]